MDGGHLEDPPAVGQLKVYNLYNIGQSFHNVDDPHQQEDQGHVGGEGHPRHRAPQKEGAGVPHEHLGRVGVEEQEGQQPPQQRRREDAQLGVAPPGGDGDKEQGHRDGHRGGQAVQPVGDVHRVDGAHDDKGGEDHIQRPAQRKAEVEKGHVQGGGEPPLVAHEHEKQDGGGQLQQKLLQRGEPQILVPLDLLVVVQKADHPEDGGEEKDVDVGQIPRQHSRPAGDEHGQGGAGDEHQPPHGGGAGLGFVPLGPHLPDLLAGLQPAQGGQDHLPAQKPRGGEADNTRENHFHGSSPSGPSASGPLLLFSDIRGHHLPLV